VDSGRREAILEAVISNSVYLLFALGVAWCVANRDLLGRAAAAFEARRAAARAEPDRAVAELRAAISAWEHKGGT
jgi:hypothetical protein